MLRIEAQLCQLSEQAVDAAIEGMEQSINKQAELDELNKERKGFKKKKALKEMPEQQRNNKLNLETKLFMNIIKMICYRAETAVANEIAPFLNNGKEEKRMLEKQTKQSNADLVPNYENKTLTVILHSLSAPCFNNVAE